MLVNILLIISMFFMIFGVIGLFRYDDILAKLLTSSLMDAASLIILILALAIKLGFSPMMYKLITVLVFMFITNPVVNHLLTKVAYKHRN